VFTRAVTTQPDAVEQMVADRIACQGVFDHAHPPQSMFFVHEVALRLPVGSKQIMSAQLHHLLRMSVRPHVTIRVILTSAGAHAGLAGSCCLMEFADFAPVVAIQNEAAGYFLEELAEVALYERIFCALTGVSLDQTQTKALIDRLAVDQYGSGRTC
jgi:Domain of unknown function (DUF5753)